MPRRACTPVSAVGRSLANMAGFDPHFLSDDTPLPTFSAAASSDVLVTGGSPWLDYTHFSLSMSRSRRVARVVAWNIDGATLVPGDLISRSGIAFRPDPRIPESAQLLDDIYARNDLDRGHVARRADLLWQPGAERANSDSFYFTNITPQMSDFNQASRGGLWGRLEDDLLAEVALTGERFSVFGGPVLSDADPLYRGAGIPTAFWKMFVYRIDGELRAQGFLLRQTLDGLDDAAFPTGTWRTYAYTIDRLRDETGVDLGAYARWERVAEAALPGEAVTPLERVVW